MSDEEYEHPFNKLVKIILLFGFMAIIFWMIWMAFDVNIIPDFLGLFG